MTHPGRVGVFVIAFNAAQHLRQTISRIPPDVYDRVEEIYVFDDCSPDDTFSAGVGLKSERGLEKLRIYTNTRNLRYGGNQKRGYLYAIERGFDVVVLLHGDGQYAPEVMWQLVEPLLNNEADLVMGTRMTGATALRGGMPFHKFLGNRVLTWTQNRLAGMHLSEFHSGYRAFRCDALQKVPFLINSDEWHFDTQVILQFQNAGLRIREIPIPTFYGKEICHVNGLAYAWNCARTTLGYRLHRMGLVWDGKYRLAADSPACEYQPYPNSSHAVIREYFRNRAPARVLELGCADGRLASELMAAGHSVVGIESDARLAAQAAARGVAVLCAGPETCDFQELKQEFDVVVAADVLEHLRNPGEVLARSARLLRADGEVILAVPNVANLAIRLLLLAGRFPYGRRGILDRTHVQFYTLRSALELVRESGWKVRAVTPTPLPLPVLFPRFSKTIPGRGLVALLAFLTRRFRKLLGYEFVIVADKVAYREERGTLAEIGAAGAQRVSRVSSSPVVR
ncbi:MAG TPA: bifunctional glycosyltransferase/class I SAM-dependent methyltransferase [Bryobacterales bacterium]|nr:bifunctional glycosyltransferase/class I SAM-dependent methyltransferase [Bryobacterales bacterium]